MTSQPVPASAAVLRDVPAPAKINLFLHVVGRRADGYHLLQTAFRFIDLCDVLHFERRADGRIKRITPLNGVPSEQCLTVRAATALQQATGCTYGANIELVKRIPAGGGLGGGSSDAATVLLALNRLWGTGVPRAQLLQIALTLGADVPVFVFGHNAFAEGVGEQLQAIRLPPRWYVVVQPAVQVSTAQVFSHPNLTRNTATVKITDFADVEGYGKSGFGQNDLQAVVCKGFNQVEIARQVAVNAAARAQVEQVRMSGSGACLFVECVTRQQATFIQSEIAATIRDSGLAAQAISSVAVCAGLDQHPLQHWAS